MQFGIARIETSGRNSILRFYKHGIELYNLIDKWLQSPIIAKGYTYRDVEALNSVQVVDDSHVTANVISSKTAKEHKIKAYATERKHSIEIWKYDPHILATNGIADNLSVLLSKIIDWYGSPNRYYYNDAKPKVLVQIKWADLD